MGQVLDAIAPIVADDRDGNFPYPDLIQSSGPHEPSYTSEGPRINGINMPGQWLLTTLKKTFGWQEQKGNFQSGAVLIPTGDPLVHIEYEVRIWESGTMGDFRGLLNTLFKKPARDVKGNIPMSAALGIHDHCLKDLGVVHVVVEFIDYPKNPLVASGGKGPWVGKMGFVQFRPPVVAGPVPDQTTPDPGPLAPPASNSLETATAAVTSGSNALQTAAALKLVPPPV